MDAITALAFVVYFVVPVIIGVHFWRAKDRDSMEDYIFGSRSFGFYVSVMLVQASNISG